MRRGQGIEAMLGNQLAEPGVTQVPCRHLHRNSVLRGVSQGVEALDVALYPEPGTHFPHKSLVSVRLLPAKGKITVRGSKRSPRKKLGGSVQHIHRIYTAADCKEYFHFLAPSV